MDGEYFPFLIYQTHLLRLIRPLVDFGSFKPDAGNYSSNLSQVEMRLGPGFNYTLLEKWVTITENTCHPTPLMTEFLCVIVARVINAWQYFIYHIFHDSVYLSHICHEPCDVVFQNFLKLSKILAGNLNCFEFGGFLQNMSYINDLYSLPWHLRFKEK